MTGIAIILMLVAMGMTLAILITGIVAMARGGEFNQKWSNRLMRYRIVAQGIAIVMFAISIYMMKHSG
ncbi:twin transmembrane helix small protein [Aestuariispira ectoiniformans]|uniref:twin transmembrane helix small protein n=1 Tax=Aestuariispira ectoiniformans TaxID=2775080 RepID=UPI00223B1512|nr:twin transmembrane helix small protein [Aestuariispira ectoiniformans]